MDLTATAARSYTKSMTDGGYLLHYAPLDSAEHEVLRGMRLLEGDTAYIENAAGTTIDKVEGFEKRAAPPPDPAVVGNNAANPYNESVFTQRTQGGFNDAVEAIRNLGTDPAVTAMRAAHRASGDEA